MRQLTHIAMTLCLLATPTLAQQPEPEATTSPSETSEVPQVPGLSGLLRGLNAGITYSGLHDAATGWSTIFQPAIGYSFSDVFSIDITVPIFMYRLAESRAEHPHPDARLVPRRGYPGDVIFALHAQFIPHGFGYQATASVTAPTGDQLYGLPPRIPQPVTRKPPPRIP